MSSSWNPSDVNLKLELRAAAYEERELLMLKLEASLLACGCLLMEEGVTSATQPTLHFEIELQAIFELYSTLQAAGLDLSRSSHEQLAGLCTLHNHPEIPYGLLPINAQLIIQLDDESAVETPLAGFA